MNRRNKRKVSPKLREENKLVGPVDHELPVLTVATTDGSCGRLSPAMLATRRCSSTYFISADWPGAGQNEIERRHPGTSAMFVAGCGGDQNPLPRRTMPLM